MGFLSRLFGGGAKEPGKASAKQPVCDVCSKDMQWGEGYGLTTRQVATTEAYWEYLFTHQWSMVHQQDAQGDRLAGLVIHQAAQPSAWLICDSCAVLFQFDRGVARQFNRAGVEPPDNGPANAGDVALAAAYAWSTRYDTWPNGIKLRESEPPPDGSVCDFCRRRVYPDEVLGLMKQPVLEVCEAEGGLRRRGGPSKQIAEMSFWLACSLCTSRASRIMGRPITEIETSPV